MNREKNFRIIGILLGVGLLLTFAMFSFAQSREKVTEEFHQTYNLPNDGRVSLKNINGSVRIHTWDSNQVKVDAVKWAYKAERLADATIVVDASENAINIKTDYAKRAQRWSDEDRYDNPASVEYTITVPRAARLEKFDLINGDLQIEDFAGTIHATCINGEINAKRLSGEVKLSTINGQLNYEHSGANQNPVNLSSVNGAVELSFAGNADAEVRASTVHGSINNDFGLEVKKGKYVGQSLEGALGRGGTSVSLKNVNGSININRSK
ncbi:MAG: DUF4097 family beta strand repeat-containing protein [Acidobacteriota bacterium]